MKGLGDMMKKAQEMQENMQKAQQELANREITGESGGGMVTVVMRGTHEVNRDTLESRLTPGVYVCGEVLDIDGDCGGYNLQWAWSSGYVAGTSAAEALR